RLGPEDRERLQIVAAIGDHLLRMINEVLDISKIEAGRLEVRPAPFPLVSLIRDVAATATARAEAKGLSVQVDLTPNVPACVLGDAQKIRQILDNLLGNAVKFTETGGVSLQASIKSDRLVLAVRDTGPGLSAEAQARLFVPFHQTNEARSNEPGTGLGLAISQRLAHLMGGDLTVSSQRGAGSTFTLTLPLEEIETDTETSAASPSITGYHGRRRTVLVVDDVEVNRRLLEDLLNALDFQVELAADADEALASVTQHRPDAIILDLRLPGMDGLELT